MRLLIFGVVLFAGCATPFGRELEPGMATGQDVVAQLGPPQEVRTAPNGEKVLWYPRLIEHGASFAARIAPDGKLIAIEQRLTEENIAKLSAGAPAGAVRDLLGPPWRQYALLPQNAETWEYLLAGFNRRRTLYVRFFPDHLLQDLYVLERRGASAPPQRPNAR